MKPETLETLARGGFAARGLVYCLVGYLAVATSDAKGTMGVLDQISDMPAGNAILGAVGAGLLCYGLFRLIGAWVDVGNNGHGAKGLALRGGHAIGGAINLYFAWLAVEQALGLAGSGGSSGGGSGGGAKPAEVAASVGGEIMLLVVGIGFMIAAANQLVKVVTAGFMGLTGDNPPALARWTGRAGCLARAAVFGLIGWRLAQSWFEAGSRQTGGVGAVLDGLREHQWLYLGVAGALFLFGIFSFLLAIYVDIDRDQAEHHG